MKLFTPSFTTKKPLRKPAIAQANNATSIASTTGMVSCLAR